MKVAISTDGGFVSEHFGRCPEFTLVEIEEGKVKSNEVIPNPGHHPGFLPEFLSKRGVIAIVCGGMGMRAQGLFAESGIETVMGITGPVEEVINKIIDGTLEGGESFCQPGAGKGYGVDKTECDHPEEESEKDTRKRR